MKCRPGVVRYALWPGTEIIRKYFMRCQLWSATMVRTVQNRVQLWPVAQYACLLGYKIHRLRQLIMCRGFPELADVQVTGGEI